MPDTACTPQTLLFHLKTAPGAVERALRVIRVRGFQIWSLNLNQQEDIYLVNVQLQGNRCIHNLCAQLNKLVDILSVTIAAREAQQEAPVTSPSPVTSVSTPPVSLDKHKLTQMSLKRVS